MLIVYIKQHLPAGLFGMSYPGPLQPGSYDLLDHISFQRRQLRSIRKLFLGDDQLQLRLYDRDPQERFGLPRC